MSSKDTNPKDILAAGKLQLNVVPSCVMSLAAMSFFEGASKYGAFNWRHAGIKTSVYISAMERHLTAFKNGETRDAETQVPHLASIIACAGIIADAQLHGTCTDDRADDSDVSVKFMQAAAGVQAHLRDLHKDKTPLHYFKNRAPVVAKKAPSKDLRWREHRGFEKPAELRGLPEDTLIEFVMVSSEGAETSKLFLMNWVGGFSWSVARWRFA